MSRIDTNKEGEECIVQVLSPCLKGQGQTHASELCLFLNYNFKIYP